jgi:uncharacterized protein with PhoU and TrkA domain
MVNCCQKCGYILNQNKDEDATELSIAQDDLSELKVDVSFQGCVYSEKDSIWCEVQTLEELADVKFTSVASNEEEGNEKANSGKSEPLATICQHCRAMIV